jgi:GNAT superfamily N-acetyltransferase
MPPGHDEHKPALTRIRPYRPEDHPEVMSVIKSVFKDHNFTFDPEKFDSDLNAIDESYHDAGGEFWVLETDGAVTGTVAAIPRDGETCELKRLYLLHPYRGRGHGLRLIETVIEWAHTNGRRRIVLWSDVAFTAAHRLYEKSGFTATQETRSIDPRNPKSVERFFVREG